MPVLPKRLNKVALACGLLVFFVVATLISHNPNSDPRFLNFLPLPLFGSRVDFDHWHTTSQFRPVSQNVTDKSLHDLCEAFPKSLLRDIQPVLKTGHAVLESRVKTQLESTSACLADSLLIISDVGDEFAGNPIIDILADLPPDFVDGNEQLESYVELRALAENGTLSSETASKVEGWRIDKFKFLPQVSRAWHTRPGKKWYVFYEDDTYIVWDSVFRLLDNYDPDKPWYFGSPSPGARGFWMAYGGAGYVLSREAVRRLVKYDYDDDGVYVGSELSQRWEDQMMLDCCGDSALGLAVHEDAKTNVSGLFPMIQPHSLHSIPFSDTYWCQPVIATHKSHAEDMRALRRWEESRRVKDRPLLFADLVEFLNLTKFALREDWDNADFGGYHAPDETAHASSETCANACEADEHCLQWTYHLRDCAFVNHIRLGQAKEPGVKKSKEGEGAVEAWNDEEKRSLAGWDLIGIERWMSAPGRDCEVVKWMRPSITRIF